MSLKHGLLGLISYGDMTGYDLDKVFNQSLSFFWQANTSQIYRELAAMERLGWLTSKHITQRTRPNKRVYSITADGRQELIDWLSFPGAEIEDSLRVKSAFLLRVFFGGEVDYEQALSIVREFREKCDDKVRNMQAAYEAIKAYDGVFGKDRRAVYWQLTAMFGDEFYQAGIIWADKAIALLEKMK